jgi:hypothetical protein
VERDALITRLDGVSSHAAQDRPDLAHLAEALAQALRSTVVPITPHVDSPFEAFLRKLVDLEKRWLPQPVLRRLLQVGIGLLFLAAAGRVVVLVAALVDPAARDAFVLRLIVEEGVTGTLGLLSYAIMLALELTTGLLLAIAFIHFLGGRDAAAIRTGTLALVIALTLTNVLAFYFDQFAVVVLAFWQLLVLLALRRYSARQESAPPTPAPSSVHAETGAAG